ncbi:rubrerythrin [Desulfitispora alkaliphila]|uniref:ferritin family protein n=1 Tax=Desulfitispora alkaliphila TaxID=622674 RepID=UPI003D1E428C
MSTDDKDFLKRTLINQQEAVRDYQRFADQTEDSNLKQIFSEFAENEGQHAQKLKQILEEQ